MQNLTTYIDEDAETSRTDTAQAGIRRFRLRARGHVVEQALRYDFQLSFTRQDQDFDNTGVANVVRDAAIHFDLTPELSFSFGQTKLFGNRQRVISSGDQQMVDRGLVNRVFNLDRDTGFFVRYTVAPQTRLLGSVTTGEGRGVNSKDASVNWVARFEHMPFGEFSDGGDMFEGDLSFEATPKVALGFTYNFNDRAIRQGGSIGPELSKATSMQTAIFDMIFKYRGFSTYLEYANRFSSELAATEVRTGRNSAFFSGQGLTVQSGYFVWSQTELVARYAEIVPNQAMSTGFAELQKQTTVGVSHYLNHHRVKVQYDLTRSVSEGDASRIDTALRNGSFWLARLQVELGI